MLVVHPAGFVSFDVRCGMAERVAFMSPVRLAGSSIEMAARHCSAVGFARAISLIYRETTRASPLRAEVRYQAAAVCGSL